MIIFPAEQLLKYSKEELWDVLSGEFYLRFPDGVLKTNDRETLYTVGLWDFIRRHPIPLKKEHHISHALQTKMIHKNSHMDLLNKILWDIYRHYSPSRYVNHDLFETLSSELYEFGNNQYNDLVIRLSHRATTVSILDMVDLFEVPEIAGELAKIAPTEDGILGVTKRVTDMLKSSNVPDIKNNRLVRMARSGVIKLNQLAQGMTPTGYIEDLAGVNMPYPLLSNYTDGHRSLYDNVTESLKAGQAINATKAELEDAVYQSRRQEILNEVIGEVQAGDCGTKDGLWFTVLDKGDNGCMASDLELLAGKYYTTQDDPDTLREIMPSDKHLIGKHIKMRVITHCAHPDPNGVCETCLGAISFTIPRKTNIGQLMTTNLYAFIIQRQLSKKHYLASSIVQKIVLNQSDKRFLKIGEDGISYYLADRLRGMKVKLYINPVEGENMVDLMGIDDIRKVNAARLTEITGISIEAASMVNDKHGFSISDREPFMIGSDKRRASFTYEMLDYVKRKYWDLEEKTNNFIIDMSDWDFDIPFATVPMKNDSLIDFSNSFKKHIESDVKQAEHRDLRIDPDTFLIDTFRLINSELTINMPQVEVAVYGSMIRSHENYDYALPKPWSSHGIAVMGNAMVYRDLAATMAFERHVACFGNPKNFIVKNRIDHPMGGACLMPAEVLPCI